MQALKIDFETASDVDLKARGVYNYMRSPLTRPLFAWWQIGDGPLYYWHPSQPCPPAIVAHIKNGGYVKAHNAGFERLLMQLVLTPRYGWPTIRTEQFICTAATAAALSLPRDLAGLGDALGLAIKKNKDGWRLIRLFSLPRPPREGEDPAGVYFNTPDELPEDWKKFQDYGRDDVIVEADADTRMVPLRTECQDAYWRSERINDRGIRIDVRSAIAAIKLAGEAKLRLNNAMKEATGGAVTECTQVKALTEWVESQGVTMVSAAKADIEDLLECDDLPERVRRAVELRQEAAKTSVSKLSTFLERAGDDHRVRGAFLFRAAGTGRYSSTGAQMHNLPRPRKEFGDAHLDLRTLFSTIREGDPDRLRAVYGDDLGKPLWLLSDAIRGFLWAAPGHELLVADYAGIEGAVAAWFAGEDWKVKAMFDLIDNPALPDLYRRAAAGIFNTTPDLLTKKDPRRQVGKVSELSLQYQGGVGAFRSMARNYSLKIDPVFEPVWEAAGEERRERATKRYDECLARNEITTQQLTKREWIAAELVKLGWRETHPAIVAAWKLLENAMFQAVMYPGEVATVLKSKYVVRHGFLWCMLPSGRCLAYGAPRISAVEVPWADKTQEPEQREKKDTVTVIGTVQVGEKSVRMRYALYGGLAFENIVQAIALDLLENGIMQAEKHEYPVIGHVHDEIITEVPKGWGDVAQFEELICELPGWADGLPLTASGWRGKRYRKD